MDSVIFYGLRFGETGYFIKGKTVCIGKFNNEPFSCMSKSGSQNLWLPFRPSTGLKLFHPQGPSGSVQTACLHFESQKMLFEKGLAPKPLELLKLNATFENVDAYFQNPTSMTWDGCYGVMMERVFSGGYAQISRNLEKFGVGTVMGLYDLLLPFGNEALTLKEYGELCLAFGGNPLRVQELINELKGKMPENFNVGPDLFTPSNIVLDHFGECKLIDFDHCNII